MSLHQTYSTFTVKQSSVKQSRQNSLLAAKDLTKLDMKMEYRIDSGNEMKILELLQKIVKEIKEHG